MADIFISYRRDGGVTAGDTITLNEPKMPLPSTQGTRI